MNIQRGSRRVHYWLAAAAGVPTLVVVVSGLLLQVNKNVPWIQPPEHRGGAGAPTLSLADVLDRCRSVSEARIRSWEDVDRVDYRPRRGLIKVTARNRWEIQLDPVTGEICQVAYRRSDLMEDIHTGDWFHDLARYAVFLPNGIALLVLVGTGAYMFVLPIMSRRRRAARMATRAPDRG